MIWFSSDLHLGHESCIKFDNRPFYNADDMNQQLIKNFNQKVGPKDTLYLLGDLCFRISSAKANSLLWQLNGKKILIRGNHDIKYDPLIFESVHDFLEIKIDGQSVSLMHYPMVEWPKSRHGGIHLHGHQHNTPDYNYLMKKNGMYRYDVGVTANGYAPVSWEEIKLFFEIK